MQVSLVIATFNRRAVLERTLPLLLTQDFPSDAYEVIVVVDGSTDGTLEWLQACAQYPNLRVLSQPNRGQAAAINAGIQAARGAIILFLDDDILCGPNVVAEHAHARRDERTCLAFGPVLASAEIKDPLAHRWVRSFSDDFFERDAARFPAEGWYGCMACANSSAPRSVLLEIGGLDESFSRGNDADLGFRLLQASYRFTYLPACVTHQLFSKTRAGIIQDASDEGISEIRLCRKHPEMRVDSRFGSMSSRSLWKRFLIWALATAPFSAVPLLTFAVSVLSALRKIPAARAMSFHLFLTQQNIATYRSAVRFAGSWNALRREFGLRLPVLMYHNIGPLRDGFDVYLTVSPELLERHLKWIRKHGYTPIRVADWVAYQREGKPLAEKPILLTFDDAYKDLAEFGLPLLRKYGYTGTVFVVTDEIGGTNAWDLHLGLSEQPLMSEEQIRLWSQQGIEFGAHTRTHADLTRATLEETAEEMLGSRKRLEEILGLPVTALAYPYGYYTEQVAEIARQHFDAALTCDLGMNSVATDLLHLHRSEVVPFSSWGEMRSMASLGFNAFYTARHIARSYRDRLRQRLSRTIQLLFRSERSVDLRGKIQNNSNK